MVRMIGAFIFITVFAAFNTLMAVAAYRHNTKGE